VVRSSIGFVGQTGRKWLDDQAPQHAAAVSFYTLLALAPLLVIAVSIAGLLYGPGRARDDILSQIGQRAGSQVADAVDTVLTNAHRPGATIVGFVLGGLLVLFGASRAISAMHTALNAMWNVRPAPLADLWSTVRYGLKSRLLYFAVVLLVGLSMLVLLVLSAAWTWVAHKVGGSLPAADVLLRAGDFVVTVGLLTLLLALLFAYLADARPEWPDLWRGSLVTAVLFDVGRLMIGLYLSRVATTSLFGAAGSAVALLLWTYYSAMIVLFGAELTQAYARRRDRPLVPRRGATLATLDD
jgi:membrane protein